LKLVEKPQLLVVRRDLPHSPGYELPGSRQLSTPFGRTSRCLNPRGQHSVRSSEHAGIGLALAASVLIVLWCAAAEADP
jgi:hypothetical protein